MGDLGNPHYNVAQEPEDNYEPAMTIAEAVEAYHNGGTIATTMRAQAREAIEAELANALYKEHEHNYETLYVHRDGAVSWYEHINRDEELIDRYSDSHIATIPSVITVGTGSVACNCDYCSEIGMRITPDGTRVVEADDPRAEGGEEIDAGMAIGNAVDASDGDQTLEGMLKALDEIPLGYFDDEDEEEDAQPS